MPLVQTRGAASAQGFGEFAQVASPVAVNYIEEVFSTYLYTGTGAALTITNNIDLSTKGGLVWFKPRTPVGYSHFLYDTSRGIYKSIRSNTTGANQTLTSTLTAFNTTGFTLGDDSDGSGINTSAITNVSWTFREQPKFFDIVTWTGDGVVRNIAHNLGSVPGCIMVKRTDSARDWAVYHRSLANTQYLVLNSTAAAATGANRWDSTTATSTVFTVGGNADVNTTGGTYVAYLFAHDAGGFGLTGTDNVISCGSYTGTGVAGNAVTLGYEPQWLMVKRSSSAGNDWTIIDNMRGMSMTTSQWLYANEDFAETAAGNQLNPTATGFDVINTQGILNASGSTYIYIAIRRGPMKVPTVGTSVFSPTLVTGNGTNDRQITGVGFPPDLLIGKTRSSVQQPLWYDKLRGNGRWLESNNTLAEQTLGGGSEGLMLQDGFVVDFSYGSLNSSGITYIDWVFRRAPSFFDEVCYTGTGSNTTFTHNLTVVPELIIVKRRDATGAWDSYSSALANTEYVVLNTTAAKATGATRWNSTTPTSSVFSVGTSTTTNASAGTYVAYLFATCAGVSKVGSYTGTATTLQVNCGFTAGARFVLIKRTDSTGDWYVWDSARGIIAGNDPYLLLNSTAAEVTSTDYIDTYSAGFEISSTAPAAINASAGTFVFLAVA